MPAKTRNLGVTNMLLGALLLTLVLNPMFANADHQPADKVVASGGTVEEVGTSDTAVPGEPIDGPTELLATTFKTSSPTDLMLHLTLECSIITDVTTPGSGEPASISTGEAEGRIKVWMTFDSEDPAVGVIAINSTSSNPQPHNPSSPGEDIDKVTFCNRAHKQTLTDMEEEQDGNDELRTYLRTKAANAFNWVYMNTGNGLHTVRVWAEFVPGTITPESSASGFVGNRMLIVEPTKMSNHAKV